MTKKEMAIVIEAFEGFVEAGRILGSLCEGEDSFISVMKASPFGKIEKLLDLVYAYIPTSLYNNVVEDRMFIILHDESLPTEERIEAIENLRKECGGK